MKRGKKALVLFLAVVMVITSVPAIAAPGRVTNPYTDSYTESRAESVYKRLGDVLSKLFGKDFESYATTDSVEAADLSDSSQNDSSANMKKSSEEVNNGSEEVSNGSARQSKELEKQVKSSSNRKNSSNSNKKESKAEQELVLVEDATTVENGELLRASTYNLNTVESAATTFAARDAAAAAEDDASTDVLKYFNTTLYDYDQATINNATHKVEVDSGKTLTEWEGIYFNGGDPWAEAYGVGVSDKVVPTYEDDGTAIIQEGDYLLVSRRSDYVAVGTDNSITATTRWSKDALWHIKASEEGTGYQVTNAAGRYMVIGSGTENCYTQVNKSEISIIKFANDTNDAAAVMLKQKDENQYLNQWGGPNGTSFGGYSALNDIGSVFYLYKISDDYYTTDSYGYAAWNSWKKHSTNADGQKMYTGLVENTLDVNKDIVFTKPDGGIFNNDATVKDIYPHVEMPFVFNPETGIYSFDASENGVYFKVDSEQGSTANAAATTDATGTLKYARMYFDKGNTQSNSTNYGDGSTTIWMPFNNETNIGSEGNCNYHFGMRTTIPFSMTSNGRVKETDTEDNPSDSIKFSFSGDDDVWVFIDGHLVIDLGGIHNRLDAEIDFAQNTVTYSVSNAKKDEYDIASFNDSEFELTQEVFGNLIPQDRTTFAATDNHELTIFYLERGAGSSNCKIEFNLPVKDTVTVKKDATKSWAPDKDEQGNVIDGDGTVTPLTDEEQAMVDNIDFGFTLYRKTAEDEAFVTVNNTRYYLINPNGQVVDTPATDGHGHFTLKNGYSARFISTDMDDEEGVTYYVAEDLVSGFVEPDYNYDGRSADGFYYVKEDLEYKVTEANQIPEKICEGNDRTSDKVTVKGGSESQDSLVFVCSNFLDADMPNPSARPNDDVIVIDYGLPVEVDILSNDLYRGDTISVENIYCVKASGGGMEPLADEGQVVSVPSAVEGEYGTLEYQEDGKFIYTLKKQLTGVEVFSYIVKASSDDKVEYGTANLFIVPATSMYYEENFSGFNIDDTGAAIGMKYATANSNVAWADEGTPQTDCQEPGVVGTYNDSPYGSDKAYLNDSTDSNGSSKSVNTTGGYAQFQYDFTGTGTAVMARVSKETGYIRVIVKQIMEDGTKEEVDRVFIDTMVLPQIEVPEGKEAKDIDTLYNIPVYDNYELDYGTYVVNVSVYKAGTKTSVADGSGKYFYLDGIKVYQPMDLSEPQSPETLSEFDWMTRNVALAAYAADAESDCTIVQLRDKLIEEYTVITEEAVEGEDGEETEEVKEKIEWNNNKFVSFTDTHGEVVEAEDYVSIGPKNEIYLNDEQEITFSLADWDTNTGRLYLGMKAPAGTGTVQIGGRNISINNATDCYYDISTYGTLSHVDAEDEEGNAYTTDVITFTIKAAAGSLISVTNVKVTGIPEFVIVKNVDIDTEGEEGGDNEVPDEEEYVGPYTEEHPFVFPAEVNASATLEAEYAELHNDANTGPQNADGTETWALCVSNATWDDSEVTFVNCLNSGDRITIPYYAEKAGTYTVTVRYRSGSPTNYLNWFSRDNMIVAGSCTAGNDDSRVTKTVTFEMIVAAPGAGVLTFNPTTADSPQLDKFDIVLESVVE